MLESARPPADMLQHCCAAPCIPRAAGQGPAKRYPPRLQPAGRPTNLVLLGSLSVCCCLSISPIAACARQASASGVSHQPGPAACSASCRRESSMTNGTPIVDRSRCDRQASALLSPKAEQSCPCELLLLLLMTTSHRGSVLSLRLPALLACLLACLFLLYCQRLRLVCAFATQAASPAADHIPTHNLTHSILRLAIQSS